MEKAGAILVGKTNSPVFGFRGTCDNYLFGPSRNPSTSQNTGGSSGGSAGAVADGLLPLAEGTDGGGSIRIPASWCGVFGYKPSFGRVPLASRPNAFGGDHPFLFEGPITRTVEDAALAMYVLAGYDSRDPFALEEQRRLHGRPAAVDPRQADRLHPDFGIFPVDRRDRGVVEQGGQGVRGGGRPCRGGRDRHPPPQRELSDLWCRLSSPLNVDAIDGFKRAGHRPARRPPRRPAAGVPATG